MGQILRAPAVASRPENLRTFVLAATSGIAISNGFSLQPLLPEVSTSLGSDIGASGLVVAAPQIGYTIGLLLLTPLGDRYSRKKMTYYQFIGLAACLFAAAVSVSLSVLVLACLAIGVMITIVIHLNSFAASLASPTHRSQAVGAVATGIALGILGGRVMGGILGGYLGWRPMLVISAVLSLSCAVAIRLLVPDEAPKPRMRYVEILRSLFPLLKGSCLLKEAAFAGAFWFAAFSAFWACLAAHVAEPPFYFGPQRAGLFGLVGIAGALSSRSAGLWADRIGAHKVIVAGIMTACIAFATMWYFHSSLWALIIGVLLVDIGLFSAQVANQARVLSLDPNARSRLYSIYMFLYYSGGAMGSIASPALLDGLGWNAVCGFCLSLTIISIAAVLFGAKLRTLR